MEPGIVFSLNHGNMIIFPKIVTLIYTLKVKGHHLFCILTMLFRNGQIVAMVGRRTYLLVVPIDRTRISFLLVHLDICFFKSPCLFISHTLKFRGYTVPF